MEVKEMDNAERLAVVETELKQLNKTVTNMNDKLDVWNQNYVPRNEINEAFRARDQDIKEIRDEVKEKAGKEDIKSIHKKLDETRNDKRDWKKNFPAWVAIALSAVALLLPYLIN